MATQDDDHMTVGEALALALGYAERGIPAGPVGVSWDVAKQATNKRPLTPNGFKDFTTEVVELGGRFRTARLRPGEVIGVGLHPGLADLMVLDVDIKHGMRGDEHLHDLERQHREIPVTWRHQSASGGSGIWLRKSDGARVGNAWTDGEDHTGVELRSDAGFIMAPGTHTPWGDWVWEIGFSPEDVEVAECPDWLAAMTHRQLTHTSSAATSKGRVASTRAMAGCALGSHRLTYANTALALEADRVRQAQPGARNNTLNVAAFKMGTLIASGAALDPHDVVRVLSEVAFEAGLERPEVGATIGSGLSAGLRSPRRVR